MNTCETCTHWDYIAEYDKAYGWCSISNGNALGPQDSDQLAYAKETEDGEASLMTKPNFGCVQWQEKT